MVLVSIPAAAGEDDSRDSAVVVAAVGSALQRDLLLGVLQLLHGGEAVLVRAPATCAGRAAPCSPTRSSPPRATSSGRGGPRSNRRAKDRIPPPRAPEAGGV
ncbi:hypothetical protein E2562_014636 [Oryza meyeriana var. granulata]|uniref:Uncharacterized protein n=1 Tax=Oryza meyeriana var. granulata TaxID=110450 RepID=A0A6G1D294_9ORYZ|nr:hypothetical protein E2562_014636 [Oryza meyeriana var. granulata]